MIFKGGGIVCHANEGYSCIKNSYFSIAVFRNIDSPDMTFSLLLCEAMDCSSLKIYGMHRICMALPCSVGWCLPPPPPNQTPCRKSILNPGLVTCLVSVFVKPPLTHSLTHSLTRHTGSEAQNSRRTMPRATLTCLCGKSEKEFRTTQTVGQYSTCMPHSLSTRPSLMCTHISLTCAFDTGFRNHVTPPHSYLTDKVGYLRLSLHQHVRQCSQTH